MNNYKGYMIVDQCENILPDTLALTGRNAIIKFLTLNDTTDDWRELAKQQTQESRAKINERWNNVYVKCGYYCTIVEINKLKRKQKNGWSM